MEAQKTIAHEIGGIQNDALRFGLHGVKSDIVGSHPLESAYQSASRTQEEMKRKVLTNTYGSAFPLKSDLEKQILSRYFLHAADYITVTTELYKHCHASIVNLRVTEPLPPGRRPKGIVDACHHSLYVPFQRPPGAIQSSMLGLEALTGTLDEFGFEDYLNDPCELETFRPLDMHHGMEVRLGVSKGPICPSFI